jgi:hypothetical protein
MTLRIRLNTKRHAKISGIIQMMQGNVQKKSISSLVHSLVYVSKLEVRVDLEVRAVPICVASHPVLWNDSKGLSFQELGCSALDRAPFGVRCHLRSQPLP